jgi:hypothetical protein
MEKKMSSPRAIALWEASTPAPISDRVSSIPQIVGAARQLRKREQDQIIANLNAENYEMVTTFVWHRTMTLLKQQLTKLGNQFISELLQRPDIDERTELTSAISETEAITLARDLGIINSTQAMRLVHSQQVITHFGSVEADGALEEHEGMTPEDAVSCLRVCVQGILGHESIGVAEDFSVFRRNLESKTFDRDSPEIVRLQQSPYLFVRTAIGVLLSVIRSGRGAALEHAARNALLVVPLFWPTLKNPERWQIGQAYASEFNEGNKEAVKALHAVLTSVKGFDYVPENLRSNTFTRVAAAVIAAHQGLNNFYNEPGPTRELANLGSSIPSPALPICVTAALCVKLGNLYGVAWNAQESANQILKSISKDRWLYYLDGRLENDLLIIQKLRFTPTVDRWIDLMRPLQLDPSGLKSRKVRALLAATNSGQAQKVMEIAHQIQEAS